MNLLGDHRLTNSMRMRPDTSAPLGNRSVPIATTCAGCPFRSLPVSVLINTYHPAFNLAAVR